MPIIAPEPSKKLSKLCAFLIVVGLLLAVFGYFGPFVKVAGSGFGSGSSLKKLEDINQTMIKEQGSSIRSYGALKFFSRATFVLGIVTLVWFVLLCVLYIENPELIYLVIGGLTVLFSLLTFIFTFVLIPSFKQNLIASLASVGNEFTSSVVFGLGGICLPIGGLLLGGGTAGMALTTPKVEVLHKG